MSTWLVRLMPGAVFIWTVAGLAFRVIPLDIILKQWRARWTAVSAVRLEARATTAHRGGRCGLLGGYTYDGQKRA